MVNRKYALVFSLIFVVLLLSFVSASDVAYIYKSKVDKNIVSFFNEKGYNVDEIKEADLLKDLSKYNLVFVGDENFKKEIPINKYPSVIINHYIVKKAGLTKDGISQLVSNKPLEVNFNGKKVQVYSISKDSKGVSIPYYYLDNQVKASSLEQYAGTYTTSSGENFGDVVSFGNKGSILSNGNVLENNICFFGISKTEYWTSNAENLFEECVKFAFKESAIPPVIIICTNDSDCGTNQLIGLPFCSSGNVFRNFISFKCNNAGTAESYCTNQTTNQLTEDCIGSCTNGGCDSITCTQNSECDDGNSTTEDICVNPGTGDSSCLHNIYVNVTKIRLVSFVATPDVKKVTLNFSASSEDNSIIKGYLLTMDKQNWTLVSSLATGYVFEGLNPSTSYLFYAKAIDINNISSEEMNISVTTLSPSSGGENGGGSGGGGGSITPISGSFSYCKTEWQCTDWSNCKDGKQTRACFFPAGMCHPETDKPAESQSCVEEPQNPISNADNNAETLPADESRPSNAITGASIAEMFGGKNTWRSVLLVIILAAIIYLLYKKFAK